MNLILFAPELVLIFGILVLFVIALGTGRDRLAATAATVAGLAALTVTVATLGWWGDLFCHAYRIDLFAQIFKLFILLGLTSVALFGSRLRDIRDDIRPEYFLFLLIASLGLVMLVSCVELISLLISLELSSFAIYLMIPLRRERDGLRIQMESAAKYVIFGVLATGIMLFGMSYLFGLTGSTYFSEIAPALIAHWTEPMALAAIALTLLGLFFKLAAFPMHLWAPDVYQGAANETTAYITGVPKAAAVAVIIRFLLSADSTSHELVLFLSIISVVSMSLGNLVAIVQKDIKRMFGYSAIAHAGYVTVGFCTLQAAGFSASVFYALAFLVMSLPVFLVICQVSTDGENLVIADFAGLHERSPLAALIMGLSMFALAGIPPFAGFIGKLLLMKVALDRGLLTLVVLMAINSAIGIYYYLNIVRVMYFEKAGDRKSVPFDPLIAILGILLMLAVTALGIAPGYLMESIEIAIRGLLL
ncbi:MAG: NADH-quinone oxidoreductase subunit N [Geobacteraceae bacterium]|nr:NADH-quinone oxidoreductase subunit N [Geobacteraceae bacterium]